MKYEKMKKYGEGKFRRITGMRRRTFNKIVSILVVAERIRRSKGGPKPSLQVEDMLLAALEYWREYRSYAHISVGFGLSESQIFRIVKWVEDTLTCLPLPRPPYLPAGRQGRVRRAGGRQVKDGTFSLPGKKALLDEKSDYDVVLYDCTESPIERPKKTGNAIKIG